MGETEEYFPRGGKKPAVVFKKSSNFLGAPEKTEKKKKRPKKKGEGDDGYLSDEETREIDKSVKNCAIGLSYKSIKQGVLVLGRVRQVHETRVIVMLPCRMIGNIMACHVSEAYNKVLEAYVNDQTEKVPALSQMFRPGQYIAVKVLEVENQSLMLSTMPQHVNGAKQHADIVKGALFQCAVSSIEDHGYVMDIGIPNTRAFLPTKDMNPDLALDVGTVTWCAIKSVSTSSNTSIVSLSTELGYLQGGVLRHKQNTPLLPATTVELTVDTPLENGIEGTIFGDTTCYIQRQHVDKVKGKKPALGQKIRARVLYVMPTRNCPFLTMKNIFETTYPDLEVEQTYKDGDIVDDAQVLKIIGRTVHFKLSRGCTGVLSLRRIQVHEELDDADVVAKSYPPGSTHRVRVLCYNLSDYIYSVTDEPDLVNEKYFSVQQLSPGELVPATVTSVSEKMVELKIGRVRGYVPQTHLTETGLFVDPKKAHTSKLPMKKFKVGQSVCGRVLCVEPARQSAAVTLKPSLVAPSLRVLASYDRAHVGQQYTGVVKLVRDYLLVSFFNNVTAFIPRWFVSKEARENLSESFHRGQILTCTVLDVKPEEEKMVASLITPPFDEKREPKPMKNKRKQNNKDSEEIPNKKHKNCDNDDTDTKKNKNKQTLEEDATKESDSNTKKKKKRNDTESSQEINDTEDTVKESKKKKKKRTDTETSQENIDAEQSVKAKQKKKRNDTASSQENIDLEDIGKENKKKKKRTDTESSQENIEQEDSAKGNKKKKKNRTVSETSHENIEHEDSSKGSQKKKKKHSVSEEESDPIESDIYEEEDILTPHEQGLLDMSDCKSITQYKKRAGALLKAIDARARRIEVIDSKIESIEERGLTAKNKKYHTAMQSEKLLIQERTQKLLEAYNNTQVKLKEMGCEKNDNYKEEQKKRKKEKVIAEKEKKREIKKAKPETEIKEDIKDKIKDIKVVESLEPALEVPSAKDFWSAGADVISKSVQDEQSSSSEDEAEEQTKKKRKKLTVAEKLAKVREEEERLRAMERAAIDSEAQPRSVEQFERSVLAHPASSQLWIAYMAFHLQATELERARAVARKALAAIPFREEHEKLNVWLALLNLEHRFGTKESQQKTLEDALQYNEPRSVHCSLVEMLADIGKQHELSSLVDLVIKKYKRDPEVYIKCGGACYKLGLVEKARQVMQKAIAVLDKKEHVHVLVQFALLERGAGCAGGAGGAGGRERAEALFEQVLAVYPQRVDVCAVYVHMLLSTGDVEQVRQVMERMTSQKLPARKMKILYKKWIEVEEKYGSETQVENIKQRALEFIEKAKF